jgi:hypothetical protein
MYYKNCSSEFALKSELHKNTLDALKSGLRRQQILVSLFIKETDTMIEASFIASLFVPYVHILMWSLLRKRFMTTLSRLLDLTDTSSY